MNGAPKTPSPLARSDGGYHIPFKSPKHHRRRDNPTQIPNHGAPLPLIRLPAKIPIVSIVQVAIEHRQRDEAREPEQHRQRVEGEHGEGDGERGEEFGGEAEVEDDEAGPDGDEDEEGVLRGGVGEACDWGDGGVSWIDLGEGGRYRGL